MNEGTTDDTFEADLDRATPNPTYTIPAAVDDDLSYSAAENLVQYEDLNSLPAPPPPSKLKRENAIVE